MSDLPDNESAGARASEPPQQGEMPFAIVLGTPITEPPKDLYIPPDALEVFLEAFQGPLDLLLYLIRKQNFNILDIPLADVTRQYLSYVEQIRKHNLELASEYLLMAAMLIEIKSRMLLPPKKTEDGKEAEDPRAELVRRMLEYEQMKLAAARLDRLPVLGRDFLRAQIHIEQSLTPRFPDVSTADLREAWLDILKRAKLNQHHKISREQLSVREHMSLVLKKLQGQCFVEFENLFNPSQGVPVLVVTFVALLELAKETNMPVMIHTPHRDKKRGTSRSMDVCLEHGLSPSMVVIDHNNEETCKEVLDRGFWCAFTIYPKTKMGNMRMVDLVKKYGSERVIVDSSADWGVSDPLAVPKTANLMLEHGISRADVELTCYRNALTVYGKSGQIKEGDWLNPSEADRTLLFEGNSVMRGQPDKKIIE